MARRFLFLIVLFLCAATAYGQIVQPSPQAISAADAGAECSVAGSCANWTLPNVAPSFTVQMTGTFTGTLTFKGSADCQSFFSINATKLATGVQATTTTTTGQFALTNPGILCLRVVGTTVSSGGMNLTLTRGAASSASKAFPSFGALATGDLLYASAANVVSGLTIGSAGQIVRSTGTLPAYSTATYPNTFVAGDLAVATATNVLGSVADAAVGQVLTSGGVGVAPAYTATPNLLGVLTDTIVAIATTSTDGHVLTNTTAATGGATVQMSPRIRWRGNAWDTSATETVDFFAENLPATAATPTGTWKLGYSLNGAGATYPLTVNSLGQLTVLQSLNAGSVVNYGTNAGLRSTNFGTTIGSTADGVVELLNTAGTGFTSLKLGGDIVYSFAAATITSGFSTSAPSIVGKASAFAVTIAATPGITGTVAFNATFTNIPMCSCTNTITANAVQCVPTATTAVINGVWVANDVLRCIVLGF